MAVTKQLPQEQWQEYFDNFTRTFLEDLNPEAAVVEVLDPRLGDQFESDYARVIGISYDPKDNVFEVALEGVDHLVYRPREIWVVEEDDGFVSTIEVVRGDGTKEIIRLQHVGLQRAQQ
ncbi:MAG: DUF5335 family protein [Rhodothermus sp.]|nr:DUF5335 family protein [Rhodothermus sp.]